MTNWTLHFHQLYTHAGLYKQCAGASGKLLQAFANRTVHVCMDASKGESHCESDSTETEQLLNNNQNVGPRKKKRYPSRFSCQLIKITEKGAVFMILYNIFFATTLLELNDTALKFQYPSIERSKVTIILLCILALLCPSIGLVSDSCFGRYKFLTASLYLWLTAIVFMALDVIVISRTLYLLHFAALILSTAC